MALSREAILAVDDLSREEIEVPEWGGTVFVRMLTLGERLALEAAVKAKQSDALAVIVAYTACDEAGAKLFTLADVEALAGKSATALVRVATAAQDLNALTPDDIEELEKNSETSPPDDAHYGSRHILG